MRALEIMRIAIESLLVHKARALLTMLGIIIGVGAVIAMVAVGQGAQEAVEAQISSLGTNILIVFPSATMYGGVSSGAGAAQTLTEADVDAIVERCPDVAAASPLASTMRQVVYSGQNWSTRVQGGNADYLKIRDWGVQTGAFFSEQDVRSMMKVCVLGQTVVQHLFPDGENPIGKIIRIYKLPFTVIGVLTAKGQNAMGFDQDDIIIAPFPTVQRMLMGIDYVSQIIMSAVSEDRIPDAQAEVTDILRIRHRLQDWQESDFTIRNQADIAAAATSTSSIMTMLLGSIASVSLIVGGIGIMNIMLVSVQERTREIGIRISIGARKGDILGQFLIEAVMISVMGGIIGIAIGLGSSSLISRLAGWPVLVSSSSVLIAFAFSAAVGVFFGFYPARKASSLNPIEALRYE
jgi:putative ABC transport system permease protein